MQITKCLIQMELVLLDVQREEAKLGINCVFWSVLRTSDLQMSRNLEHSCEALACSMFSFLAVPVCL